MKPDPVLPANLIKRLEHQGELDGLSLAEMVEKLVADWKDYDASTSPEDNRRRLELWVPAK